MFTWICPTCGREVPPSYTECPDCAKKAADPEAAAAPPPAAPGAPVPHAPTAPPVHYRPAPAPPSSRPGLPTWALTIVFAFAIFGVVAGVYWLVGSAKAGQPTPVVENPPAKTGGKDQSVSEIHRDLGRPFHRRSQEEDRGPFRPHQPLERRHPRTRRQRHRLGTHPQLRRGRRRHLHLYHRPQGLRVEGHDRAAHHQAQDLRASRLAEPQHRRPDHRAPVSFARLARASVNAGSMRIAFSKSARAASYW